MTGSEKQVQWATKIQQEFIRDVKAMGEAQAAKAQKAGQGEQWGAVIADVVAQAEAQQDASWWINNRAETSVGGRGNVFTAMYKAAIARAGK